MADNWAVSPQVGQSLAVFSVKIDPHLDFIRRLFRSLHIAFNDRTEAYIYQHFQFRDAKGVVCNVYVVALGWGEDETEEVIAAVVGTAPSLVKILPAGTHASMFSESSRGREQLIYLLKS